MDSLHHTEQLLFQKHLEDILHDCVYRALTQEERSILRWATGTTERKENGKSKRNGAVQVSQDF